MRSSPPDKTMLKNIVTVEGDLICILWLSFTMGLPWRRQWLPTPVLLPGKPHGRRSLVGCSPWGCWGSDTAEWLHFHFLLSCIGEGNGNPLQCSCLENPRDGGAWWAAIYGVSRSRTQLKWLSSSKNTTTTCENSLALVTEDSCSLHRYWSMLMEMQRNYVVMQSWEQGYYIPLT